MFSEYSEKLRNSASQDNIPFPKYADREKWNDISAEFREYIINKAESYLGYRWPVAPAGLYLDFYRNGNRSRYEHIIFEERRLPLYTLAAAECFEGKGRFVDDIVNGIWTTLDEASWVVPAHNEGNPLPDVEKRYIVDLFAAECSSILSWILFALGDVLDSVCPQITSRMRHTLNTKIFTPFIENNYWWTGIDTDKIPNNWNPWIISNILSSAVFAYPETDIFNAVIDKCLVCLDNFVKYYAPDGGCDEGPGYWTVAGACLFDCIDVICDLSGGKVNLFNEPLVANMCSYIYKMHIAGSYYVCYADAQSKTYPEAHSVYRMGKKTGDENLIKMGCGIYRSGKKDGSIYALDGCSALVYRTLNRFFCDKELSEQDDDFPYPGDTWFEGIQVMTSRFEAGKSDGIFFSAKGGNNDESHNHNDIGSFILYCDGKPAVVDIGKGEYVKDTFSEHRYEILQMQSGYHNLPIIGGITQKNGSRYKALNTSYELTGTGASMKTELKAAYPAEAEIESWIRSFNVDKTNRIVTVSDSFSLNNPKDIGFVFMTAVKPVFTENTMILNIDEKRFLSISFDGSLKCETEIFDTSSDVLLNASWGECLYRSILRTDGTCDKGQFSFIFEEKDR